MLLGVALVLLDDLQELGLRIARGQGEDEGLLPVGVGAGTDDHAVGVLAVAVHRGVLGVSGTCDAHVHDGVDEGDLLHFAVVALVVGVLEHAEPVHHHEAGDVRPEDAAVPVGQTEGHLLRQRALLRLRLC